MSETGSTVKRRCPRVLLGVTGSVAAVKGPELVVRLVRDFQADVRVLLTAGGQNFWEKARDYDPAHWEELMKLLNTDPDNKATTRQNEGTIQIHTADEEWKGWNRLGDPVMHIDLRDWADVAVVAPLSAHTLAKLANGLCDDTLSCVLRAWDFGHGSTRPGKPLVVAPAMNTAMWEHPLTQQQLTTLQSFWNTERYPQNEIHVVVPQVKELACGEIGTGALAPVDDILQTVEKCCSCLS